MSYYAFLDAEKTDKITADDAFKKYSKNKIVYYCPSVDCSAKMTLKSLSGENSHFFAALPSSPHSDSCQCCKHSFIRQNFDEDSFVLDELFTKVSATQHQSKQTKKQDKTEQKQSESTPQSISTIAQLYAMCVNLDIFDSYNGNKIWQILLDERSKGIYKNGIYNGIRLIKCHFVRYERQNAEIYLKSCDLFDLKICIKNDLFEEINTAMYKAKQTNTPIIIFAKWHKENRYYTADIHTKKQYKILT